MMRWFDRPYLTGGLSDEASAARRSDYADHVAKIGPMLADGAEQLVTSLHLHDGLVAEWRYEPRELFVLRVLVGDLQRGYEWLTLNYGNASLVGAIESDLVRWWGGRVPNEIVEDEVDRIGNHRYEHRMVLWPDGEVGVRFSTLGVDREVASASDREEW